MKLLAKAQNEAFFYISNLVSPLLVVAKISMTYLVFRDTSLCRNFSHFRDARQ